MSYRRIDQKLCDRVRILHSCGHPHSTVYEMTGVSESTQWHMKQRGYTAARRNLRPPPSDFAIVAADMPLEDIISHYRTGPTQARRWIKAVGMPRPRPGQTFRWVKIA
jgi:hypothetical protein